MKRLNYAVLEELGYEGFLLRDAPEKVLQFGEGGFLRAFVDYFFDMANEKHAFNGKVCLVQPIPQGLTDMVNTQEGLYTLYLRGFQDGRTVNDKRVISAVSRCIDPYRDFDAFLACAKNPELRYIVSNTTEAGIVYDANSLFEQTPPVSFPAKLTRLLYERFTHFGAEKGKGFVILSCELIDDNGKELKKCVEKYIAQWQLGDAFARWVEDENLFCSSLVDRIVTGYPRAEAEKLNAENGYEDTLIDTGEVFGAWVIEGPEVLEKELPFVDGELPVIVTPDHKPYKQRKVRILNGAHTTMVLGAYLAGQDIVRSCMQDDVIRSYMNKAIHQEIIPTLDLPKEELTAFAESVQERFANPFIDHQLLSISLNSVSKWRARCMPSLKAYMEKFGLVPSCLAMGLAALIAFYRGDRMENGALIGRRPLGNEYRIQDDEKVLAFFMAHREDAWAELADAVLGNEAFWGEDLRKLPGLYDTVCADLRCIDRLGAYAAMREVI
ncbi:MAG: tagaturonate reductase [Clostridiales bacterium]|nr:tagaturonate reductase [Clostridiales bacterium]